MDLETVFILTQKELRDARRNRWFILYTIIFGALSLSLAWLSLVGMGNFGLAGFGRTGAGLINLVLLIVPLMGLTLGALGLSAERESGTLLYLLAQPLNSLELLLGKYVGLAMALMAALGLGFGLTGVVIATYNGLSDATTYLWLVLLTFLLAVASLSLGFFISAVVSRSATAVGVALFVWLLLVFFGDLGLMGTAVILRIEAQHLLWWSFINPLQLFKTAALLNLRGNLELMGPAGAYAFRTYGRQLQPLLIGLLLLWGAVPLFATHYLFAKRGAL